MAKSAVTTAKTIKIEQTGSAIRRHHSQRSTLIGLKLNKFGCFCVLLVSLAVRGMILKVNHLDRIIDEK